MLKEKLNSKAQLNAAEKSNKNTHRKLGYKANLKHQVSKAIALCNTKALKKNTNKQ